MTKTFLNFIRIDHWIKNLLIFLPLFFAGKIKDIESLKLLIVVFFYFSITASMIYVINDLLDIKEDRLHPQKKSRPLPSGAISVYTARIMLLLLFLILLSASFFIPISVVYISVIYLVVNILYSVYLKTIPILELFILSLGFVFRILIGGFSVSVILSKWIIMLVFFLALYIVITKRRGEILNDEAKDTRKVLKSYTESYLTSAMIVILGICIITYIMYTVEDSIIKQFSTDKLYLTTFFVVLALLRHLQRTLVYNDTESPVKFLFKDKFTFALILLWISTFYILIY